MKTFIDLFCGIGGFRLALESFGLRCVFSSEIDQNAKEAYYKNFNEMPFGDILKIKNEKIPPHDILCAGFPCQAFTTSGLSLGFKDKRGLLIYEIIRIAKYHKPKILLLENVQGILSNDFGKTIKIIDNLIKSTGYNVYRQVLNASFYGIPQSRKRVYFVCLKKENFNNKNYFFPSKRIKYIYINDILESNNNKNKKYITNKNIIFIKKSNQILISSNFEYQLKPIFLAYWGNGKQSQRVYSIKGHACTLLRSNEVYYLDNIGIRPLTITECKRIMGFPDNHFVSEGNKGFAQLGNSIIPEMIKYIWQSLNKMI